ncbi:MAG TPA: hypothetical protein VMB25_07030 [Bryobacteraceae bacterium]|nr:hypothetical protein [Bryobacteraceae bacterium]
MPLDSGIFGVKFLTLSIGLFAAVSVLAQPPAETSDAEVFARIAGREVSQLHECIPLAQWLASRRKKERWETRKPEIVPTETHLECLSLVKTEALPSGAKVTRALYFYPPSAPTPAILPASNEAKLISSCTLGMIRVEAEVLTPEIGRDLEQAVRRRFTREYGDSAGNTRPDTAFWSPGSYGGGARWIHNAEIVAGYDSKPGLDVDAPGQLMLGPVVFVGARLPSAEKLQHEACCTIKDYRYRPIENENFHHAVALARANAALSAKFSNLYDAAVQGTRKTPWRASLLPVLREWLSALKAASRSQRAAGLLAADLLLEAAEDAGQVPGWPQRPGERTELEDLGADFELNEVAGDYSYARTWAKRALRLDPQGVVGQMVVIGSLARGSCDAAGSEFFRQVLRDGEGLLAKGLDAHAAGQVHFMVGDAYSDIVAIAGGDDGPNGEYDGSRFRNEADANRKRALQHYRAGLALDNRSENARDAWRQAWRLAAGLLPGERYVCFGD